MKFKNKPTIENNYYDEESQTAIEFLNDTHATKANEVLWWYNHEDEKWENDIIETKATEFIQRFLPEKKPSFVTNVYKKIRAFSKTTTEEKYKKPTVFLNGLKYEFSENQWKTSETEKTIFNPYLINIELTEEQEAKIKLDPNLQELKDIARYERLLWPDEEIRKWALANYATCFMPQSFEKVIFNLGQGRDGKSTTATLISNILKNLCSSFYLNDDDKFALSNFPGRTCLIDNDFDANQTLILDTLKHKTTKGDIEIESKNKDKRSIYNRATLFVNSNFPPKFNDISNATERRLNIVLFENSMETNKSDDWFEIAEMEELLQNPIFHYLFVIDCLNAFSELYDAKTGEIKKPQKIEKITQEISEKNNIIYSFLYQKNIAENFKKYGTISLTKLYETYSGWCFENSITQKQAKRNFNQSVAIVLLNKFKIQTTTKEIKTETTFEKIIINENQNKIPLTTQDKLEAPEYVIINKKENELKMPECELEDVPNSNLVINLNKVGK